MGRVISLLVATAALLSGCGSTSVPTTGEATTALDRLVAFAEAGDFDGLCSMGDLNCEETLAEVGRGSVPTERPSVLGSRAVEPDAAIGATGGRVLELCGMDGFGRIYDSEILVFHDAGTLRVINPVYWSGVSIASGRTTADSPSAPPICPH